MYIILIMRSECGITQSCECRCREYRDSRIGGRNPCIKCPGSANIVAKSVISSGAHLINCRLTRQKALFYKFWIKGLHFLFLKPAKNQQDALISLFLLGVCYSYIIIIITFWSTKLCNVIISVLFVISVLLAESDVVREGERIVKSGIIRLTSIRDIIDRASNLIYRVITQISEI